VLLERLTTWIAMAPLHTIFNCQMPAQAPESDGGD
jgi:hypothetical protein